MPVSDVQSQPDRPLWTHAPTRDDLTACVGAAVLAPSIHNSQPWRFRVGGDGIDVYADRARRLDVIDPSGRQMFISIGAAVLNLRLAVHQRGRIPLVRLFPEPAEPDLVASLKVGHAAPPSSSLSALAAAIPRRHTNRLPFTSDPVAPLILDELAVAAQIEGATLRVADAVGRSAILRLVRAAEQRLREQGVYRGELSDWTRAVHGRPDGSPVHAFSAWDAMEALPLRDFGLSVPRLRGRIEPFERYPAIVVLATDGDSETHWVRAGQALQRALLTATVRGLAATPMSQPLEIPSLRDLVIGPASRQWAQMVLRVGHAPPTTSTRRRALAEVLLDG